MIASLNYQFRAYGRSFLTVLGSLALFIPYAFILGNSVQGGAARYYMGMCFAILFAFCFAFPVSISGALFKMALGYGTTRRGWYFAHLVSKLVYISILLASVYFVMAPVGTFILGGRLALQFPGISWVNGNHLQYFILVLLLSYTAACVGEVIGYILSRYNAKVLSIILIVVAVLGGISFMFFFIAMNGFRFSLASLFDWRLITGLLVTAIGAEAISWALVRRVAA